MLEAENASGEIRKLAELVEEAGTDLAFIQAVNAVAGESGDATTVEALVRYVDLTDRFRSDFGPRLEKRVATALDELAAMDDTAPGDAPVTPPSPLDRKRAGDSEGILLSSRSTRNENEANAGDEEPIADAPKKSRGARRTSVGTKDYDGALQDASRGVGALQAREDTAAEATPPPPPILAPRAPATSSGDSAAWRAWAPAVNVTDAVRRRQQQVRDAIEFDPAVPLDAAELRQATVDMERAVEATRSELENSGFAAQWERDGDDLAEAYLAGRPIDPIRGVLDA